MGTNFYWKHTETPATITTPLGDVVCGVIDTDNPAVHIGKRSAAGMYCYDCDVSLCRAGAERVHYGSGGGRDEWFPACPKCGAEPQRDGLATGPVAVELGFAQPEIARPAGVRGTSSFSWAQTPYLVRGVCAARADDVLIEDEYGREYTGREFAAMLDANCAIQFTDSIGKWFS